MARPRRRNLRTAVLPRLAGAVSRVPPPMLLAALPLIRASFGAVPGWRQRVESGMRAALGPDGYSPHHVRDYFSHLADLLALAPAVYRHGVHAAGLDRLWVREPRALGRFQAALEGGRGAVMVCPHLVGHEIVAGSLTADLPITVLVRKAPDPQYEAVKQRWYRSLGVEVVYRPQKGEQFQGLAEVTSALRVLRRNQVLAMTPDLLQRPGSGVEVDLFGRRAELPAGAFFLAIRAGAPLLPSFFHHREGRYHLWGSEALEVDPSLERDAAVAELAQQWAKQFEGFVRAHPDMWQFWLDKRWSAWLQG